jgi:hypothetical protein
MPFMQRPTNLYIFFTRYAAVRPIPFTSSTLIVRPVRFPETLMVDIAYLAGLLISFGLLYGFSYVCSRL